MESMYDLFVLVMIGVFLSGIITLIINGLKNYVRNFLLNFIGVVVTIGVVQFLDINSEWATYVIAIAFGGIFWFIMEKVWDKFWPKE